MSRYTIGVDIGTTGIKTVLLDTTAGIVATANRENTLHSPGPGFAEADPVQWYRNVVESIREVLAVSGVAPDQIGALATSGMVPAVVAVDQTGTPLRRAILQNDARAHREVAGLAAKLATVDLVTLTGSALTQQSVAPTTVWLRDHEPDVYARTAHWIGSYDWVLSALGAPIHVEQNWALESGLFEIDGDVATDVLQAAALDPAMLAPVRRPGTQVGELSRRAADETGLRAGTALVVGGADHVLSAYAAGVNDPGDALVKLGGAGDILVASDTQVVDERLYLDAHPVPGHWLPNGCMATSGSLIRWFQALIGGPEAVELTTLDAEAALRSPAEVLCLPYFLGEKSPIHDPDLRGVFAGMHLGHTRADMYRSVLEAIAFGFRHHVDVFAQIGIPLRRVMITNGGSKSTLWKQIHADVLGQEMHPVRGHPGASLGAAVIAAIGVGALADWSDAARFITLDDPYIPDPARRDIYDQAYATWRELSSAMTPISHAIARTTR
ncbi:MULTISPECIES: FGGY-family carbohydrate kinase [Mycolicibacterium]|jgi:xylulokinase|uniref:FGGY-family carbohydrate kinase n=1 Tax=Mycolicibacterium austroafricanum TaxID=39687 RepID=A0ABT8HLV8_MYCAO|nr:MULTISPECIES: FGGY-family carbohydrate kinase [Mycolicibacterium]MDN4521751.1 FGGY-family carbohydrate kinase [Mycolicibacterium austroafricanum]PQP40814.1 carbohydrate kinase [Mycolicibacterium austroafricanum]QRZ09185.1 FGGY-family carbohydrate kinase [Mycolicibacterium austroafricanum]QZT70958.1 FGGY-family carbohydrate kinase [Mycolicibacterium austroafricanum]QZY48614.1 FGGY-family carbohydrate kinase [Mycolicibacterium austroafricanum]